MTRRRPILILMVWCAAVAAALAGLHALGDGPLALPGGLGEVPDWAAARDPLVTTAALGRGLGIVAGWYLLASTVLAVVAEVVRAGALLRLTGFVVLPAVRRLARAACGATLAAAASLGPVGAAAASPAPPGLVPPAGSSQVAEDLPTVDVVDEVDPRDVDGDVDVHSDGASSRAGSPAPPGLSPPMTDPEVASETPDGVEEASEPPIGPPALGANVGQPNDTPVDGAPVDDEPDATEPQGRDDAGAASDVNAVVDDEVDAGGEPANESTDDRETTSEDTAPRLSADAAAAAQGSGDTSHGAPGGTSGKDHGDAADDSAVTPDETTTSPDASSSDEASGDAPPEGPDPAEREVVSGDSFWSIAADDLAAHLGRPPSDAEVVPHWKAWMDANADRLTVPGDPDLLFPGQRLVAPGASDPDHRAAERAGR